MDIGTQIRIITTEPLDVPAEAPAPTPVPAPVGAAGQVS